MWLWAPGLGRHICDRSWGWRESRAGSLRPSHGVPQHQAGDAASLGGPSGSLWSGVLTAGERDEPLLHHQRGHRATALQHGHHLVMGAVPAKQRWPGRAWPGEHRPRPPPRHPSLPALVLPAEATQQVPSRATARARGSLSCRFISARAAPGHRRALHPGQGSPYRARLSTPPCPAWSWCFWLVG